MRSDRMSYNCRGKQACGKPIANLERTGSAPEASGPDVGLRYRRGKDLLMFTSGSTMIPQSAWMIGRRGRKSSELGGAD